MYGFVWNLVFVVLILGFVVVLRGIEVYYEDVGCEILGDVLCGNELVNYGYGDYGFVVG